jgi:hypothetical protein
MTNNFILFFGLFSSNMKGKGKNKTAAKLMDELDDEGLAVLIPDIQMTAIIVEVNYFEKETRNLIKNLFICSFTESRW